MNHLEFSGSDAILDYMNKEIKNTSMSIFITVLDRLNLSLNAIMWMVCQ